MSREVQEIPPAPRFVRWPAVLWYRWPLALLGFVMTVYGGIWTLMLYFATGADEAATRRLDRGTTTLADAMVTDVNAVDREFGGEAMALYAYSFETELGGHSLEVNGRSFARAGSLTTGVATTIEYLPDEPHVNRIVGARLHLPHEWLSPNLWLGLLVFPGLLAVMLWLQGVFDVRRMMAHGDVAVAEVLEVRRIRAVVPGMLGVQFRYRDHRAGQRLGRQWVRARSPLGIRLQEIMDATAEPRVPVLHHRRWPQFSRLALPGDFPPRAATRADAEAGLPLPPA